MLFDDGLKSNSLLFIPFVGCCPRSWLSFWFRVSYHCNCKMNSNGMKRGVVGNTDLVIFHSCVCFIFTVRGFLLLYFALFIIAGGEKNRFQFVYIIFCMPWISTIHSTRLFLAMLIVLMQRKRLTFIDVCFSFLPFSRWTSFNKLHFLLISNHEG